MIFLGADHNGYFLKEKIKHNLETDGYRVVDCGAFRFQKTDDYVDFSKAVTQRMKNTDLGLLVCGSGHGMVIAANKVRGIRAIMPLDAKSALYGRRDDHANVVVLAAWQMSAVGAYKIVTTFLKTKFGTAARYVRRVNKIKKLER